MLESGTVNSDGGQAAALFFSHRARREHREKIFSKLKAIILFFVPLFSVLSPHRSVLFHACPFFKTFDYGFHAGSAGAFNENPVAGSQRILQCI
jgi:hypothetical protein